MSEAVTRYIKALLSVGSGLNTTGTVGQLHCLSAFEGAADIGPLLELPCLAEDFQTMVRETVGE